MGATTIKVGIGPGTEIGRGLATRRDAMRRDHERLRQERVPVRADELEAAHVPGARQLAKFIARRDAIAREVEPRKLAAADTALKLAIRTGKPDGLPDLLNRLELDAEQALTIRTSQVLVLDRFARHLPNWLCLEGVVRGADGVLRMHTRLQDGRELVIAALADENNWRPQTLVFELASTETDLSTNKPGKDFDAIAAAMCERLFATKKDSRIVGDKEKVLELGLATTGFAVSAASFPVDWQAGAYGGILLTAVAIGMLLARHFHRP